MDGEALRNIQAVFSAGCCDEEQSRETIGRTWHELGYLCDPHTAVAVRAARDYRRERPGDTPLVILSTASPYKFPGAVLAAIGGRAEGDDYAQMDALASLTGVPVPCGLAALREKDVLHRDVIGIGEMIPYIKTKLSEELL